jgi:hypothetical protein
MTSTFFLPQDPPAPLKTVSKGFVIQFHIYICIYIYKIIINIPSPSSPAFTLHPLTSTSLHSTYFILTLLSFIFNFKVNVQRDFLLYLSYPVLCSVPPPLLLSLILSLLILTIQHLSVCIIMSPTA